MKCSECENISLKYGLNHEGHYVKCKKCGEYLGGFDSRKEVRKEWKDRLDYISNAKFLHGKLIMPYSYCLSPLKHI